jgi:hypothetical protein
MSVMSESVQERAKRVEREPTEHGPQGGVGDASGQTKPASSSHRHLVGEVFDLGQAVLAGEQAGEDGGEQRVERPALAASLARVRERGQVEKYEARGKQACEPAGETSGLGQNYLQREKGVAAAERIEEEGGGSREPGGPGECRNPKGTPAPGRPLEKTEGGAKMCHPEGTRWNAPRPATAGFARAVSRQDYESDLGVNRAGKDRFVTQGSPVVGEVASPVGTADKSEKAGSLAALGFFLSVGAGRFERPTPRPPVWCANQAALRPGPSWRSSPRRGRNLQEKFSLASTKSTGPPRPGGTPPG